ncbi:GNAT family N-acetyltransferase [Almyronema epifaneia]|uniref:GNAT family N-acetyltransferase n=1 Tax=Almyronema epifaneia S1 TaxID=2991925 RepID=A0ABW6IHD9_9CYAN
MYLHYRDFLIRDWQPSDRAAAASVIKTALAEYGLGWEPEQTDRDALEVETYYWQTGGEFWVVEQQAQIVGTAGYYPIERGQRAVEIRKMYLQPSSRGLGLGRFLLQQLEQAIAAQQFHQVWIETASVLKEAVSLYERSGYQPAVGAETLRCDLVYMKSLSLSSSL